MTVSIACRECLPEEYHDRANEFHGLWDITYNDDGKEVAKCRNCGFERPYYRREKKINQMTPSQERQIEAIQKWFKSWFRKEKLAKVEVELIPDCGGRIYMTIETTDHPLTCEGVTLWIGRRGGIQVTFAWGISKVYDKEFYAERLGGKVQKR